jgi:hypothetical protein
MVVLASACASGSHSPAVTPAGTGADAPGVLGLAWTGRFQPRQQQSGDGTSLRGRNNATGTVTLTALARERLRAEITVATPLATATNIRWSLSTGACGSNTIPVLPVDQFPEITVSSSGRGQLDTEVPTSLPTSGSYHVNIFWTNGADESDVMTCANLRQSARK